eukprot:CAMPEP_0115846940 /NCGR_PEP_ID=MMETSP0287-20121206/10119_1 /TAXON_ID=412157 /ORGANISM="Chrysochromulina rotalis, Strain UIO044" /LENGTH=339 /DNA_ID=CAMNT_0003300745 /DNA_START=254 /DNA_END=1273 /DNA_ORIENTATION=-
MFVIGGSLLGTIPSSVKAFWPAQTDAARKSKALMRRIFTGCMLGVVVSLWIFSGTLGFLGAFALMAILAQNEYFSMARQNGCYPTWKLGTLGSVGMYLAACSNSPQLRDAIFPITGVIVTVYLMLRRKINPLSSETQTPPLTMNDVSTTIMGIYYFGYMPSFWVRLRCLSPLDSTAVLSQLLPPTSAAWRWPLVRLAASSDIFTCGALVQWWTMMSIVTADVAAYFAGKRFGRTQLIELSPKKTWEGLLGGCLAAMACSAVGGYLMMWPRPWLSGGLYGLMCAIMALIGDLTVSLLKRSAGVKDTGKLLPGHGGLLDRIDSYLLVAAPAYFFISWLLPY